MHLRSKLRSAIAILLTIASSKVSSEPSKLGKVVITAPELVNLVTAEGDGSYQQAFAEVFKQSRIKVDEMFFPLERAIRHFESGKSDCIYTNVDAILGRGKVTPDNIYTSYPINIATLHLFTLKSTTLIRSLEQIEEHRLSIIGVNGYQFYYGERITSSDYEHLILVSDEKRALKMLKKGRVDALVGFMPDYTRHLDELHYDQQLKLSEIYDGLTCRRTPKGKQVIQSISPIIESMHKNGAIKKILGKEFIEFKYKPTHDYEWGFNG